MQLLREPTIEPTDNVLKDALGTAVFDVYKDLLSITAELVLTTEWRYYNDGKAWLCKVVHKKKTVFWLSVWDGFIKTSFFFTEKTRDGVLELPVNDGIKKDFLERKSTGKLLPLILDIDKKEQLADLKEIARYKISLK
ncbi:DUF3788 family protein [Paludibacter sp. 221]|uniref:DUF3788 family protein n=1 Tax=Paludibacter sp. 221 TaxID=2302939 RepID=UPI0013D4108A|nr:DUF3788 family protein [Paludibacter sp. 221]NDV47097.1 DUF3788 family protein [Paludibacter sp. 221]